MSLMGSVLASDGSVLKSAGTGSVQHGHSSWWLLTEGTPAALHYQNLVTVFQQFYSFYIDTGFNRQKNQEEDML